MKAIRMGAIGSGPVNIPVKLYSAVEYTRPDFDLLDCKALDRIRYKRVNKQTGKEVSWNNIIRAYYFKDRYVILEDTDFEDPSPEKPSSFTSNLSSTNPISTVSAIKNAAERIKSAGSIFNKGIPLKKGSAILKKITTSDPDIGRLII